MNDSFRYGASNSTYRVDDTVSGRITATLPLPRAASGLSVAMADRLLFSWLSESWGTGAELLPDEPDEPPLLPQAAMIRAALPTQAVSATLRVTECKGTHLTVAETCPGSCGGRVNLPGVASPPSIWENSRTKAINRAVNISVTP